MISLWNLNYHPQPGERPYLERVRTQADEHAEVGVAVLTPSECKVVFGVPLANRGIQAVWVRVVNRSSTGTRLLMTKIAPDYYTAAKSPALHFSILKRLLSVFYLVFSADSVAGPAVQAAGDSPGESADEPSVSRRLDFR